MTNPKIVPCRMCKGREDVRAPIIRLWSPVKWVSCMTLGCRCAGPERTTETEAIAAWNALMSTTSEPAAGTVRVPVQIAAVVREMQEPWGNGSRTIHAFIHTALANDGTMWIRNWDNGDGVWVQLNPLPQPPEVPGTVESGS